MPKGTRLLRGSSRGAFLFMMLFTKIFGIYLCDNDLIKTNPLSSARLVIRQKFNWVDYQDQTGLACGEEDMWCT
jgi:hypothetical protein